MTNNIRKIRVSWSKKDKKIFGAFQWNAYVLSMYEDIFTEINKNYGWKIQYGARHILSIDKTWKKSIKPQDIEEFINRNKQLYDTFVDGISSCDLFIADITNNNPNVLLELGIAIQQNKNILIVTSQDVKDLPFDIRGFEAKKYASKKELKELIIKEIEMYKIIKDQNFDVGKFIPTKKYVLSNKGILTNNNPLQIPNIPKLKNLRIKINFRFVFSTNHDFDWFGVHLRTQGPSRYDTELILVRYSGKTRSLTWPEKRPEFDGKQIKNFKPEKFNSLEILIDENKITAWVENELVIEDENVIIENFGEIWIGCMEHHIRLENPTKSKNGNFLEVEYSDIEILDLNTTANLFGR